MARRKRSPNSIRWNHRGLTQTGAELMESECQVCMNQIHSSGDIKPPVEQVDYFLDDDGTLTIKNDICPRTVALSLLGGGPQGQKTFRKRLGDNYNIFILNLEQILKKHHQTCPGELASQVASAEQLIREQELHQKLLSHSRKRSHDLMVHESLSTYEHAILKQQSENTLSHPKMEETPQLPDNFLSIPPPKEETPMKKLSESNLPTTISDIPESIFDLNNNENSALMMDLDGSEGNVDLGTPGNAGDSSRAGSPILLTPGMTVAEAAIANKQMANTKRGSKILPVSASEDGLVKYQCPICSLELSGDHELTVHIRSHNQSHLQVMPNTCTICGKTLSSQSSLDRHMLVHSGERPFKCRICDMSFTTNGNMHRHSRIHQKNGINIKMPGKKSEGKSSQAAKNNSHLTLPSPSSSTSSSTNLPQFPSPFRDDLTKKKSHAATGQPEQNADFIHYMNDIKNLQQLKMLSSMGNYMFPFNSAAAHSAFPIPPFLHEQMRIQYMQAFMNPLNGESLAKRPCYPPFLPPPVREPSPDLRRPIVHRCKECGQEFNNQFALESHMESHIIVDDKMEAESGASCKSCKTVAKSAESLLLHTLTHHKQEEDMAQPDPKSDTPPPKAEGEAQETEEEEIQTSSSMLEIEKDPSSFMNLGFADCTTKKFPLIAKAFCEDNPDLKGNKFPVFKCQYCSKEFPVEGAKDLHEASHVPEEYTRCPKCNCHFADSSKLQEHMLKHVSDMKFEESLDNPTTEDTESKSMPQNYFLAQFGLMTTEDSDRETNPAQANHALDNESIFNSSINDPCESVMSEDGEWKIVTDNEDDAKSVTESESQILTIPLNTKKDEKRGSSSSMSLMKPEVVSDDVLAKRALSKSPASTTGNDIVLLDGSLPSPSRGQQLDGGAMLHPLYPCKLCDAVLPSATELRYHQSQHKESCFFKCKICPYSSSDKNTLQRHMRTHNGERPFKCKLCDYSFTTKANCERHLRQKHNLDKQELKDKLIHQHFDVQKILQSTKANAPKSPEKETCKSCGVDFFTQKGLQHHLQITPDCRYVFACERCKMVFPNKASISQHMGQKHSHIPANQLSQYISRIESIPALFEDTDFTVSPPPPAHSKPKATVQKHSEDIDKPVGSKLLKSFLTARNTNNALAPIPAFPLPMPLPKTKPEIPVDFTQGREFSFDNKSPMSQAFPKTEKMEKPIMDEQPLDLSVSRPSPSPDSAKGQGRSPTKQVELSFVLKEWLSRTKRQP